MQLFQPNNLSRRRPEFTPVNDPQIARVLAQHYELSDVSVFAFTGANVSSQNFKIETPATSLFLKSRELSVVEKTLREAKLTFALSELGQKVPRIIRSRDGELVSVGNEKCWVLYEFQDGDYFSGTGLQSAAETFAELTRAAEPLFVGERVEDAVPSGLDGLLERAGSFAALHDHRDAILKTLREVEEQREMLNRVSRPMHLDYHPLNLLMKDEAVVCVVDLEHLKPYPVVAGLGFAAFKLIRQAMVDEEFRARELSERTAVSTWLRGWQRTFPEDRFTAEELGLGARSRILTLINLILDAAINHNDDRLTYDLEKQIYSLYEADIIFGNQRPD